MDGSTDHGDERTDGALRRADRTDADLAAIERRRWQLWLIAGIFLVAVSGVVVLAFTENGFAEIVPDVPALRWGFLALAVAFILYVLDQERTLRRVTRAFMEHDRRTTALESRIADLTLLSRVGRVVNSVLTVREVVDAVLEAAFELTQARNGSVMLREDDHLKVALSAGPERAPIGALSHIGDGVAGRVAASGEAMMVDGRLEAAERGDRDEARPFGSAVVVPLVANGGILGVLSLERPPDGPGFTDLDSRSLSIFGEHAGTAIANAQRYESERDTASRLADVLELRGEFVAAMVHDLKSPLTAIRGFTNILRDRWEALDGEKRVRALNAVERQTDRVLSLVDEVLRSTSIEAGAELSHEPLDVVPLLRSVVEGTQTASAGREGVERRIRLHTDAEPVFVAGDGEALRHVFTNLLENAVKYSPPGSPIEVRVEPMEDEVQIHVRDAGFGIAPEDLAHVFERFRQADGQGRGGVGLGLYIVRTLVTAHGGRVWVDSEPGAGSTFTVTLPHPTPEEDVDELSEREELPVP